MRLLRPVPCGYSARAFGYQTSDRRFVLDVELPPKATQGPMVMKDALRMTGKKSLPQFNAYLAIFEVWDRYGTQSGKIIDPTKPGDVGLFDGEEKGRSRGLYQRTFVRRPGRSRQSGVRQTYYSSFVVACFPVLLGRPEQIGL